MPARKRFVGSVPQLMTGAWRLGDNFRVDILPAPSDRHILHART
jgi:hypothetical protein